MTNKSAQVALAECGDVAADQALPFTAYRLTFMRVIVHGRTGKEAVGTSKQVILHGRHQKSHCRDPANYEKPLSFVEISHHLSVGCISVLQIKVIGLTR